MAPCSTRGAFDKRHEHEMLDSGPDLGLGLAANTFTAAYQQLVEDLERALWQDESGAVLDAYQAYTEACEQALARPEVAQRVTAALDELSGALRSALERPGARARIDEAAAAYLREVGAAWPQLRAHEDGVETLLALATGMTTLAWLFGLGTNILVTPFGAAAAGGALNGAGGGFADAFAAPPVDAPAADDDGILWQEFDVGDNGEIVERTAGTAREEPPLAAPPLGAGAGDPVDRVRRAFADYETSLQALGIPSGATAAHDAADVDRRTGDLASAYLRLLHGSGTVPDVYASYARLVESATELVERQVRLARGYEQLMQAALQGHRPDTLRRTEDERYRRLLATVREAWARLDPATASPDELAAIADATARAAKLHASVTGRPT